MQTRQTLLWLATFIACLACANTASSQSARGEDTLQQRYSLEKLPGSNLWITPHESELRKLWTEVPQHRDAIVALEQALAERVERNGRDWVQAGRAETSMRAALSGLSQTDGQRSQFERQLSIIRRGLVSPDRLGDVDDVRQKLVQLADHRHALWVGGQTIRHKTALVESSYSEIANNKDVKHLLRIAGRQHRLGPAKNYREDLKKLVELERVALTSWAPLFLVGEHQRVSLLVNDSTPLTFSWTSSPEATVVTAAMAESIGLKPHPDAEEVQVSFGRNSWKATPATIPYLRFGKFELREIQVAILPPGAESAGARISPAAFSGYRVEPQPTLLRIVITPTTDVSD